MNAHAPLVHYNAACVALAAAKSTDEVKDWRDKAESEIKGSGYVMESLEAALWCFWHTGASIWWGAMDSSPSTSQGSSMGKATFIRKRGYGAFMKGSLG